MTRLPQQESGFVGSSEAAERVRKLCRRASRVDSTVLITGESGVGKELVAREIHSRSRRRERPFVAINCSAIPETLVENEFFGHEVGSYTGADQRHCGAFERAQGGTVFLDEIGELGLSAQPKILRVLETGRIHRVGSERPVEVDFRVIAATNRSLRRLVRAKEFRADLYYRLCVISIEVPPLRRRPEDIPMLISHFSEQLERRLGRKPRFTRDAIGMLMQARWPGNARQLRNVVEAATVMSSGELLGADALSISADGGYDPESLPGLLGKDFKQARGEFEAIYIRRLLMRHGGNVTKAARAAGLARRSLYKMLQRLGLQPERDHP